MSVGDKVFVLEYSHKHGSDVGVYDSPESCYNAIKQIMREWLYELTPGTQEVIAEFIDSGDITAAMVAWQEATDEYFDISETHIKHVD